MSANQHSRKCPRCLYWMADDQSPDLGRAYCINKRCGLSRPKRRTGADRRAAIIASYLKMWANVGDVR